jgi:hypothetical protein
MVENRIQQLIVARTQSNRGDGKKEVKIPKNGKDQLL